MSVRRLNEDDGDTLVPGECEVKTLTVLYAASSPVQPFADGLSTGFSSWSLEDSKLFDEGDACGKVNDRTTSVTDFEQALERRDGKGFGNPLLTEIHYTGAGGFGDVDISYSAVTAVSITSFGGAPFVPVPDTVGYGKEFHTSLVAFNFVEGLRWFPLLFHDHSGCLGEEVDLDVYSSAVEGYANSLGGNMTSVQIVNDTDVGLVVKNRYNAISLLRPGAMSDFQERQQRCDVFDEPVWTEEAGYAICSDLASDGEGFTESDVHVSARTDSFPNVTISVGGCPISVLPARFLAVGDFLNDTVESRQIQWEEEFSRVQTEVLVAGIDAISVMGTAAIPIVQSSTQVGFALPDANNNTEWVLVLVVAIESLFVVCVALIAFTYSAMRGGFRRRDKISWTNGIPILGNVFALGVVLVLGLVAVFIGLGSEREAADMAHNDVHHYEEYKTVCAEAHWEGDLDRGQWCISLTTRSETLLVRSYTTTKESQYADLALSSATLGGLLWLVYCLLKILFADKDDEGEEAARLIGRDGHRGEDDERAVSL